MARLLDDLERFKDPTLAAEEEDLAMSSAATAYSGRHEYSILKIMLSLGLVCSRHRHGKPVSWLGGVDSSI